MPGGMVTLVAFISRDEQKYNGNSEEILSLFPRPTSPSSLSLPLPLSLSLPLSPSLPLSLCTESLEQAIMLETN